MRSGLAKAVGIAALLPLAWGPGATGLQAQRIEESPPPSLVLVTGLFHRLDYHGDGPSTLLGLRARLPMSERVLVEPGVHYTTFRRDTIAPDDQADPDLRLLVLDFQLQLRFALDAPGSGRLRPWIGLGAGGAADFRGDRGTDDFVMSTFSAGAGASMELGARLVLLGEGRYRTLDGLEHRVVEGVLGVGWRF